MLSWPSLWESQENISNKYFEIISNKGNAKQGAMCLQKKAGSIIELMRVGKVENDSRYPCILLYKIISFLQNSTYHSSRFLGCYLGTWFINSHWHSDKRQFNIMFTILISVPSIALECFNSLIFLNKSMNKEMDENIILKQAQM